MSSGDPSHFSPIVCSTVREAIGRNNEKAPNGTPIMHIGGFVRGEGRFMLTEFVPTEERVNRRFPLILTTGRILTQYNVGAQTARTDNNVWHAEDLLEIHPQDAEDRGIKDGDLVSLAKLVGP